MKKTNTSSKRNLLIFLCLIFSLSSFGQILPEWVDTIGGPDPLYVIGSSDMKVDPSGNVYVGGIKGDTLGNHYLILAKYNSSGTRLFTIDTAMIFAGDVSIVIDDSLNIYAAIMEGNSPNQILILKYNINGNLIWSSTNASLSPYRFTDPIEAVIDRNRNIYIAGAGDSIPDYQNNDIITMKFNSSGVYQWSARYDHDFNDGGFVYLGLDSLLNVYVTGYSYNPSTSYDLVLLKYNSSGNQQWVRRFGNGLNIEQPASIAVTNSGTCYVGGMYRYGNNQPDYLLLKYDSSGNLKWHSIDSITAGEDWLRAIKIDSSENIYVTGTSALNNSSIENYFTMKYDSSGNILWTRSYSSSNGAISGEASFALCLDNFNNVFVTGKSYNTMTNYWDIFSIKYDTNGDTLWAAGYHYYTPNYYDDFQCSCDAANNVYLSGILTSSVGFNGFSNIITLKYGSTVNVDEIIKKNYFILYPNPTTDYITILYNLSSPQQTTLLLFNLYGQKVRTILNEKQPAGKHEIKIDMKDVESGIYFVKVHVNGQDEVRKFVKE